MFSNSSASVIPSPWRGICAGAALALFALPTAAAPPEVGVWLDDTGEGAVEISPCGAKLCGHIFWLKRPKSPKGQTLIDIYNPDAAKRKRPICGLPVFGNLQRQPGGSWDAGWVYDPKEGKTYDLEIRAASRDTLTVTGYMGTKFFGRSMIFTRAPAGLTRCGSTPGSEAGAKPLSQGAKAPSGPADAAGSTGPTSPVAKSTASKPPTPSSGDLSGPPSDGARAAGQQAAAGAPYAKPPPAKKSLSPAKQTDEPEAGAIRAQQPGAAPALLSGPVRAKKPSAPDARSSKAAPAAQPRQPAEMD